MPIYEYQCAECGFRKEVLQKISDEPLKVCPECGEGSMKKLVSAAAFRLKGGGWYETDFKSGQKKNVADSRAGEKTSGNPAGGDKATTSGSTTTSQKDAGKKGPDSNK